MFTDMVGYTVAAQVDERATLALRKEQEQIVRLVLAAHEGRVVTLTGDGFLVTFESALKATECAVDIQRRLHERNGRTGVTPIYLRIGIHLGDVEQQGTDIFGDAVNIAARIEPVAEPGGICLSGAVYEQIRNKIPDELTKLAPTSLKGLLVPIDVYRIVLPWTIPTPATGTLAPTGIAVLPFSNISPDRQDEYFADGLTEELITVLSQLRGLRVISRTSVMQFKGSTKPISQIGAELGVGSILEGSVRKAGSRLRITAQLIDARTDGHLLVKTYDRELEDVFAVQTEIAQQVAQALQIEILGPRRDSIRPPPTQNIEAYELFLRGVHLFRQLSRKGSEAIRLLEEAIRKDPTFALACASLANMYILLAGSEVPARFAFPRAEALVAKALELDPKSSEAHMARGHLALQYDQDWALSEREFKIAISLNPSNSDAHLYYSLLLEVTSRFDEAQDELRTTIGLDPLWELPPMQLTIVYLHSGAFEPALAMALARRDLNPALPGRHVIPGVIYASMGRLVEARKEAVLSTGTLTSDNARWHRALLWARLGEPAEARLLLAEWEQAATSKEVSPAQIAGLHAVLGEKEKALEVLERDQPRGEGDLWIYHHWTAFDSLRDDPRFRAVMRRLNLA